MAAQIGARRAQLGSDHTPLRVPKGTDLVEWYFEQGWTDGLPVVPPTPEAVEAAVAALGGEPDFVECRVPPRHGGLTREVLAINLVMAGCKPEYAPVVRAALLALARPPSTSTACRRRRTWPRRCSWSTGRWRARSA